MNHTSRMDKPEHADSARGLPAHVRLALLFAGTIVLAVAVMPIVKAGIDGWVPNSAAVQRLVKFKVHHGMTEGTYDFGRVARRVFMIAAAVLLIFNWGKLRITSVLRSGFRRGGAWTRELTLGAGLGVASVACFMILLVLLEAWSYGGFRHRIVSAVSTALVTGLAVSVIEETLFRGFVLGSLASSLGVRVGLVLSSAFYAVLHFCNPTLLVTRGFDPLIGVKTVWQWLERGLRGSLVDLDPSRWSESMIIPTISLFLAGLLLGSATVRTGRLWLSIGLHAGWVFVLKLQQAILIRADDDLQWLYGGKEVVTGLLGWIFLLALWWILARVPRSASMRGSAPDGT